MVNDGVVDLQQYDLGLTICLQHQVKLVVHW